MRLLLLYANPNQSLPVSPYGLDIIRGVLRAHGDPAETLIVNPFLESLDPAGHLAQVLAAFAPDLVAISIRNIDNAIVTVSPEGESAIDVVAYAPAVRGLVDVVKAWQPDLPCVLGGAGFTACPAELLDYLGLDFGLIGAGEASFARLVTALAGAGRPPTAARVAEILPALPGAITRVPGGFRRAGAARPLADEPGYPPEIAAQYELLYRLRGIPVAVRTKTGCPLRCTYCTDPINMRHTDTRAIDRVLDDISYHVDGPGLRSFHIADAELNLPYEDHVLRFCRALRARGLADRIQWRGYFNVVPFSDELIDALFDAGCRAPSFAVDSFTAAGLAAHGKNFREHHVHRTLARVLARGPGAQPEVCLLLGRPGETLASIDENIRWMRHYADLGVRVSYSCGVRIYPNTPLARTPLPARDVYLPAGGRVPSTADLGSGTVRFDPRDLVEPVVHCAPMPPRELAGYLAERVGDHPHISIFADGPWPEATCAEALRHFNIGVYAMARGRVDTARTRLEKALELRPDLAPGRTALRIVDGLPSAASR